VSIPSPRRDDRTAPGPSYAWDALKEVARQIAGLEVTKRLSEVCPRLVEDGRSVWPFLPPALSISHGLQSRPSLVTGTTNSTALVSQKCDNLRAAPRVRAARPQDTHCIVARERGAARRFVGDHATT